MSWGALLSDVKAEFDNLDDLLSGMTEGQWDAPTPAEGWNSRDQIAHLAYFDARAALAGDDADAFAAHFQTLADQGFDVITQQYIDKGRSLTGGGLRAWWAQARSDMLSTFAQLDPKDRLPWYGPPMSARSAMTARLMETWAHGYDIADTIGVTPDPTDRIKSICHLGIVTVDWSFINRSLKPPANPICFRLTSPSGQKWVWNEGAADLIEGTSLDYALLVTQRRHLLSLDLAVSGEAAASYAAIAQCFAGPPTDGRLATQATPTD
jgi:uncharacterized protein (TIGR03084 family)